MKRFFFVMWLTCLYLNAAEQNALDVEGTQPLRLIFRENFFRDSQVRDEYRGYYEKIQQDAQAFLKQNEENKFAQGVIVEYDRVKSLPEGADLFEKKEDQDYVSKEFESLYGLMRKNAEQEVGANFFQAFSSYLDEKGIVCLNKQTNKEIIEANKDINEDRIGLFAGCNVIVELLV